MAGYTGPKTRVEQTPFRSVQKAELAAIIMLLQDYSDPLNLVTDSQYAEHTVKEIETATLIADGSEIVQLFSILQLLIRNRSQPIFITHIRAHTALPGPMSAGNEQIDRLLIGNVQAAMDFHASTHTNKQGLIHKFNVTHKQAQHILNSCSQCSALQGHHFPQGINPRGNTANQLWQMDVTHVSSFGKLQYVHMSRDIFSGFLMGYLFTQ